MEWHQTAASVGRGVCIRGSLRLAGGGAVVWPARAAPPRLPPRFAPPTAACVLCGHRWPAVFHTVGLGGDGRAGPEPFSLCRATPIAAGSAHLPPPWLGRPDKRRIHATWRILVLVFAIVCRTVSVETLEPGEHPASSPEQPGFDLAIDASAAASRRPSPHLPLVRRCNVHNRRVGQPGNDTRNRQTGLSLRPCSSTGRRCCLPARYPPRQWGRPCRYRRGGHRTCLPCRSLPASSNPSVTHTSRCCCLGRPSGSRGRAQRACARRGSYRLFRVPHARPWKPQHLCRRWGEGAPAWRKTDEATRGHAVGIRGNRTWKRHVAEGEPVPSTPTPRQRSSLPAAADVATNTAAAAAAAVVPSTHRQQGGGRGRDARLVLYRQQRVKKRWIAGRRGRRSSCNVG